MSFENRLKQLRERNKITQKEFGDRIGVSSPTIVSYEQGKKKPSYETLILIANTFNVSLDWLCEVNQDSINKVETWADITKMLYAILSNEHVPKMISFGKDKNNIERCYISFAKHLLDPEYYPEEAHCPQNQYIETCQTPDKNDYESDYNLFYLESPIYKFIITYSRFKKLLDDEEIDKEAFDLWLAKYFEKYDRKIWYCAENVDFLEDNTDTNNEA